MRVTGLILLGCCALAAPAAAQMQISEINARPSVYLEGFGTSLLFCCSLNLEVPASDHVTVRAGSAADAFVETAYRGKSVLLMVNRLAGSGGRYLEVGAGIVRSTTTESGIPGPWRMRPAVDVGLRTYIGDTVYRITLTPVLQPFIGPRTGRLWDAASVGFSIGRTF